MTQNLENAMIKNKQGEKVDLLIPVTFFKAPSTMQRIFIKYMILPNYLIYLIELILFRMEKK